MAPPAQNAVSPEIEQLGGVVTVTVTDAIPVHPSALVPVTVYVPAVETIVPPGRVVVAPEQIERFLSEEVCGITVKFVVIVETHLAAFGI